MPSVVPNIAKGREVELYNRVDTSDPTNSALVCMVLKTGSAGGLNGLLDFDTFAAILAGGYTEVTNAGYAREVLTDADLSAWSPDDTNNRVLLVLPLIQFTAIAAGDVWDLIVIGYDPDTTGGTDAAIVPVAAHELRISGAPIPGIGTDIYVNFTSGWIQAT